VAGELLLDTGALVSVLDRTQARHAECVRYFESWDGVILSTEAVLTEATHLLERVRGGRAACVDFFLAGAAVLVPATLATLRRARRLLETYADLPMDYADATLVVLAEEVGTDRIFTTDRRDFSVYRIGGRKPFRIVPS
jgi:uncharacterized protein